VNSGYYTEKHSEPHNISAIRSLIREAFTASDLRRFCQDRPELCFILSHFGPGFSFEDMIEAVIEQCGKKALLPDLLAALQAYNPRQYKRYQDQLLIKTGRQRVVNRRPLDIEVIFKDRQREIQALRDSLADERVRLVSVVGRSGMGKTALVSHVLADFERQIVTSEGPDGAGSGATPVDGILYLSAKSTGLGLERIYADVGRMVGEPASSRLVVRWNYGDPSLATRVDYLLEALQDGLYLVLLDNMEHVLSAQGNITDEGLRLFIEHCLTQLVGVRLIATSREGIKVPVDALHAVRTIILSEGLPEDDASAFLRELDPQGELGLRDVASEHLRQAARRTEGIPRALQLVAGILDRDPTASLPRLLADERLFGEHVVERLVEEGYRRLGNDERRVMEALAVLDRPVQQEVVAALLYPWFPRLDVRPALHRLVHSYFVTASRVTGEYSLHSLDRGYAYSRLAEGDEPDAYTRRNLELRAADCYASIRKPASEWKTIEDLAPQLAEFEHRMRARDYDGACRVLNSIDPDYLYLWGYSTTLLRMRERLVNVLVDLRLQATNWAGLGRAYHGVGQLNQAAECHRKALTLHRKTQEPDGEAEDLENLGKVCHSLGRTREAVRHYKQALVLACESGDLRSESGILCNLGLAYYVMGSTQEAIEHYEKALAIAREIDDCKVKATSLGYLGSAFRAQWQIDPAIESYSKAMDIAREIGARWTEGVNTGNLGSTYRALGQVEQAIELYQQALGIAREIGDRRKVGAWLGSLGHAYRDLGKLEQALALHSQALDIARETEDRRGEAHRLSDLGMIYRDLRDAKRAIECQESAISIARETRDQRREAIALDNLGIVYRERGQPFQAIKNHEKALSITQRIGDRRGESYRRLGLAKALLTAGRLAQASRSCAKAIALDVSETRYQAELLPGIILLHQLDPEAGERFKSAAISCRELLSLTPDLHMPHYALATALVGQAVCDPLWSEKKERIGLLTAALAEYKQALRICPAPGVVQDAIRDLELIRAASVEGLEPVFELLQSHLGQVDNLERSLH